MLKAKVMRMDNLHIEPGQNVPAEAGAWTLRPRFVAQNPKRWGETLSSRDLQSIDGSTDTELPGRQKAGPLCGLSHPTMSFDAKAQEIQVNPT
jgi:hypothetical protein